MSGRAEEGAPVPGDATDDATGGAIDGAIDSGIDDATRVVARGAGAGERDPAETPDDATVVVAAEGPDEATVFVPRAARTAEPAAGPADQLSAGDSSAADSSAADSSAAGFAADEPDGDVTALAPHLGFAGHDDTIPSASHGGAPSASRAAAATGAPSTGVSSSSSLSRSSPLAEYMRTASRTEGATGGFDPERRIAEVPNRMPWEVVPAPEAGLHQGLPVVYGARATGEDRAVPSTDEIFRRIGPPPTAAPVALRGDRARLPSLLRRERRRRWFTLLGYGAVVAAAILGLWGVAVLAFG